MKAAYPKLNSTNSSSAPKRRYGKIIMIADMFLVVIIMVYFFNRTSDEKLNFGKPATALLNSMQYTIHGHYLPELKIFSFTITIEEINNQRKNIHPIITNEKNNTIHNEKLNEKNEKNVKKKKHEKTNDKLNQKQELSFALLHENQKIFVSQKNIESPRNGEIRLWRVDISETHIQRIMNDNPKWITPAKKQSLISFDRDKLIVTAVLYSDQAIIVQKKISFER